MILGLGGKLRSGKDTVADYLVDAHLFWVKIGFSDVLNDMLKVLNPIISADNQGRLYRYAEVVETEGYVQAKENPEVRRLLQVFGTEVGRKMIAQDLWVDLTRERILRLTENGLNVAVTGVRYPNEVAMVESIGGTTVWVSRPGLEDTGTHTSENSLTADDFQETLVNDGSLEDLCREVSQLLDRE